MQNKPQAGYEDKMPWYYSHSRPEMLALVNAGIKTALDVGCGSGNFGASLKQKFGCEVWGIEPDEASVTEAGKKLDRVIPGVFSLDLPGLEDKKFDVIFFNDVLEHLADPSEVLVSCKKLLGDGGRIIASIPNVRYYPVVLSLLRYKDFKYQNEGVMDKTHLRFFTMKSMKRLFEDAGYEVIRQEGINPGHFKYLNIMNFWLFNSQWDMKYPQFAIIAVKGKV